MIARNEGSFPAPTLQASASTLVLHSWQADRAVTRNTSGVTSLIELPSTEAAYRDAIAQASRDGANAIMVGDNPDTMANRALIAHLIGAAGIPAMYSLPEFVDEGGLIAYSFDLVERASRRGRFSGLRLCRSGARPPREKINAPTGAKPCGPSILQVLRAAPIAASSSSSIE